MSLVSSTRAGIHNTKIGQGITQNLTRIFPIPVKNNNNKKTETVRKVIFIL